MQLQRARLVSGRVSPPLELVGALVARVQPQNAGQVMKALAAELPLGPLQHLKRVRKPQQHGDPTLDILLGPTPDEPLDYGTSLNRESLLDTLPQAVAATLAAVQADFSLVSVPKHAPDNRLQWEEWAKIWPMPWKVPTGLLEIDGEPCSLDDQAYFERFILQVLQASQAAGGANVALIVDPKTQQVIGRGQTSTQRHPLAHAVMEAVEAVAARDRKLWPVNAFHHAGRRGDDTPSALSSEARGEAAAAGGEAGAGPSAPAAAGEVAEAGLRLKSKAATAMAAAATAVTGADPGDVSVAATSYESAAAATGAGEPKTSSSSISATTAAAEAAAAAGLPSVAQDASQAVAGPACVCCSGQEEEHTATAAVHLPPAVDMQLPGKRQRTAKDEGQLGSEPCQQQQEQQVQPEDKEEQQQQEQLSQRDRQQQPQQDSARKACMLLEGGSEAAGAEAAAATPASSKETAQKPYLCTGFDCFVLREPCTMCAMGLVHSRISRVVYCWQDRQFGALGGKFRLHSQRSLNHHYSVYHMPVSG